MEKLLIIDGSSMLVTAFYGNAPAAMKMAKTPEEKEKFYPQLLQTHQGVYTNAIYTMMVTLIKILRNQRPSHIAFVFDESREKLKRKQVYPDYKANRKPQPMPLSQQFETAKTALSRMGFLVLSREGVEADDLAGGLVDMFEKEIPISLMTKDADYLQLVSDRVTVWKVLNDKLHAQELNAQYNLLANLPSNVFEYNEYFVVKEMGLLPCQIPDLKGMAGDSSDNIPGIRGCSENTATPLLQYYGTIEKLYEALENKSVDELKAEWKENLGITRSPIGILTKEEDQRTGLSAKETALLSKKLATIEREPIKILLRDGKLHDVTLQMLRTPQMDTQKTHEVFGELEFNTLNVEGI